MEIYDRKMAGWPVPYEDVYVDTQYGTVWAKASTPSPSGYSGVQRARSAITSPRWGA
jgi:hypothetical protein